MFRLLTTCPRTGKFIYTGVDGSHVGSRKDSGKGMLGLFRSQPRTAVSPWWLNDFGDREVVCPECGEQHTWNVTNVYAEK